MVKPYLLTEEEVTLIKDKTGITLTEQPQKYPFWYYAAEEVSAAIAILDESEFSSEVIGELQRNSEKITETFIDDYYCGGAGKDESRDVTEALDTIFEVIREQVYNLACEKMGISKE